MQDFTNNELSLNEKISLIKNTLSELEEELVKKTKYLDNIPQMSETSIGYSIYGGKLVYRNWWRTGLKEWEGACENSWFTRFLLHNFPNENYKINMFSVLGKHYNIDEPMLGKKVLISGENLNKRFTEFNKDYGIYALDYVDFATGYDLIDHSRYLRFPFWIALNFPPNSDYETVENITNNWNSLSYKKTEDVVVVSSHDYWKTRQLIADSISNFTNITYGGKWRNNTSDLWKKFNNDKFAFLNQFKFNICSENVLDTGYVTEKIFDAIKSDCIPLYAGGGNYLEPKVINKHAIITWDFNKDNSDSIELVKSLISDEKTYVDFKEQNVILDSAPKYIMDTLNDLKKQFERVIYD